MSRPSRGINLLAVIAAARSVRHAPPGGTIVVDGAPALVPVLARELRAGGDDSAVREGFDPEAHGVAALVWIGEPDLEALRAAVRRRIPIVAVTDADHVPYVLDTALVHVPPGQGFPIDEIAAALARRLGERGPSTAVAVPVLKKAVVDELIRSTARTNLLHAFGVGLPGAHMPVMTVNQVRLVLRIALAYGQGNRPAAPEMLGVVGAGFGFRAAARRGLRVFPVAGWVVRGAIAFAGTKAVGETARRMHARSVRAGS